MKVTVFGIGYVGLVQAAVLAEVGHDVLCVDVNEERVENLKKGEEWGHKALAIEADSSNALIPYFLAN